MMSIKRIAIFFGIVFLVNASNKTLDFSLKEDGSVCFLGSVRGIISIYYPTNEGTNIAKFTMDNVTVKSTTGDCGILENDTSSSVSFHFEKEVLTLSFSNNNSYSWLNYVQFNYTLPDVNFPNASKKSGTVSLKNVNGTYLSSLDSVYFCKSFYYKLDSQSYIKFDYFKIQPFEVINGSYSLHQEECPQDFYPTTIRTTIESTTSHVTTSETTTDHTSTTTDHASTTTHHISSDTTHNSETTTHHSSITTAVKNITTSSAPITFPPKQVPKFSISSKDGTVCLVLQTELVATISYKTKSNEDTSKKFTLNSYDRVEGQCGSGSERISIIWTPSVESQLTSLNLLSKPMTSKQMNMTLHFKKSGNMANMHAMNLSYILDPTLFPNAKDQNSHITEGASWSDKFTSPIGGSYSCGEMSVTLGSTTKLDMKEFKFDAFRNTTNKDFHSEKNYCTRDPTVAIIVGVVLAAFLLIIIIIVVVLRCRAKRNNGYVRV